jgi:hypothetical protein
MVSTDELAAWIRERSAGADRYLFGIAGPPGSGKSTLAERLGADLGAPVVPMDGFHLPNATLRARGQLDVKGAPETFAAADFVALVAELRHPRSRNRVPGVRPDARRAGRRQDPSVTRRRRGRRRGQLPVARSTAVVVASGSVRLDRLSRRSRRGSPPAARRPSRRFGRSPAEADEFVQRSDEVNAALVEASRTRADLIVS